MKQESSKEYETLIYELSELDAKILNFQQGRKNCIDKLSKFCPVKVGDITEVNDWSHNGKKMRVTSCSFLPEPPTWKHEGCQFLCHGVVLKKDGSDSKFKGKTYV